MAKKEKQWLIHYDLEIGDDFTSKDNEMYVKASTIFSAIAEAEDMIFEGILADLQVDPQGETEVLKAERLTEIRIWEACECED